MPKFCGYNLICDKCIGITVSFSIPFYSGEHYRAMSNI